MKILFHNKINPVLIKLSSFQFSCIYFNLVLIKNIYCQGNEGITIEALVCNAQWNSGCNLNKIIIMEKNVFSLSFQPN